jgi:hypothetical protein
MKGDKLFIAIFKSLVCITCIFLIGYFGYNYPDAMIWVICFAVFSAFSWYFYTRDEEDEPSK